ncbi:hypothetical protein CUJ83_13845 [Methanocella sp. CWC-04]|uniref:Uncharacterized protein n=2 Tax=Methanooceanicella nereidis TaxID=2052831 RepID=A0AAP2W8I7_9EURY|nr:hypothetical protein [Methanocella sp. CWC-04]
MSGKINKTVTVGKYKGGEAQVKSIMASQGLDCKSVVLSSNDHTNEVWDIVLTNGRKVQLLASKKSDKVTLKEP